MAYQSVIVHDIDYLEAFGQSLCQRGQDLAAQYDALLGSVADQESNWQDPQYRDLRQRLSVLEGSENDDALRLVARRIEALGALQMELTARLPDLEQQLAVLYGRCREGSASALRHTAEYARKLNALPRPANGPPRVVVVDARRHPASAQHITAAVNMGAPETVTLDRSTVRSNRTGNLCHKPPRREYDRDEYPCAVFREGAGADVAYIPRGDNRGSGSSICHQLRGVPNGARVRVRVIW